MGPAIKDPRPDQCASELIKPWIGGCIGPTAKIKFLNQLQQSKTLKVMKNASGILAGDSKGELSPQKTLSKDLMPLKES